ncbi:DUF3467 domain-containing protein [Candidatus Woesearchaeota archaeon]|nr:DUF3467 domain-containing protein [Candidatus Woesearchaeota archaeon]
MSEKKQINMGIDDGKEFFAHEMSLNFNPTQFIFDFRCVTPRTDPRTKEAPYVSMKHNVVMVEPWHAKEILRVLSNVVNKYEEKYGKIEQPKAVKKHLKEAQKQQKETTEETKAPSYLG